MTAIKTSIIGLGYRGKRLLELLSAIDEIDIISVSDPFVDDDIKKSFKSYSDGNDDYRNMIVQCKPELVIIASPWECHIEQAMFAIQNGCHVALEIKGGLYIDEYLPLIKAAEQAGKKVYPLENTIFMREHLAILNMVKSGVLGEIVAVKGGYRHDLRKILINEKGEIGNDKTEGIWRSKFYLNDNGDIYPTHGLAPICLFIGIGRTDRIKELTSFASNSHGMMEYIKCRGGDTSVKISMGDIVVTQMLTEKGVIITLTHDTTLPRPKTLDVEVQGSKGLWRGELRQIYIEGVSPYEKWEDDAKYIDEFEHKYWKKWGQKALRFDAHHDGMDYIMLKTLIEDIKGREQYPVGIKDLALWSSISPFSKKSIEEKCTINLMDFENI